MNTNPRIEINNLIENNKLKQLLINAASLHGHYCTGLALGVIAANYAMKQINTISDGLEDLIAITETNNCFSDGIQYVTGCTFGNNALIFKDFGKKAFTLAIRNSTALRISALPNSREYVRSAYPFFSSKYKKIIKEKKRTTEEIIEFKKLGMKAAFAVLNLDFHKIFKIENIKIELPDYAPSHESIFCEKCGESTMATRIIIKDNKKLCYSCANINYPTLNGHGIEFK